MKSMVTQETIEAQDAYDDSLPDEDGLLKPLPDLPCGSCQHPASVHEEDGCYRCLTEGGPCE